MPQPEVDSPTRKYGFNFINGNLATEPPLTTLQPYTYKLQDSTTEIPTVKKYGYDFVNNGPPPAEYSTTVPPKPYTYKVYDSPSTSVPSKEYSYNILKDTPSTSVPYKEYTYKINDAPATTVQPKSLPAQKYGYDFLEGRLENDSAKGQLISECPVGVFKSTKKPTKFLWGFLKKSAYQRSSVSKSK